MSDTEKNTSIPEEGVSAPVDSVKNLTVPASVKIASVGGLARVKVKMLGAWSVGHAGRRETGRSRGSK
jgi:hypothetical protein